MTEKLWDVFVSHASEDKETIVRPLASRLKRLGVTAWVDEFELKLGDSLSRKIDEGLAKSRAGVVVLSPAFFKKNWPEYELKGLNGLVMASQSKILPIWHGVSQGEVAVYSPTLADAVSASSQDGIDRLAMRIVEAVRPDLMSSIFRRIVHESLRQTGTSESFTISKLRDGPIQHASLPQALTNRIEILRSVFKRVDEQSLTEWLSGFQRDTHPTEEVRLWEEIAVRYARAVSKNQLKRDKAIKVYSALLVASLGDNLHAAKILTKAFGNRAEKVIRSMHSDIRFEPRTANDEKMCGDMALDVETFTGPDSQINLSYIREIVKNKLI